MMLVLDNVIRTSIYHSLANDSELIYIVKEGLKYSNKAKLQEKNSNPKCMEMTEFLKEEMTKSLREIQEARQWWHTPLIPALGRQKQAEFEASLVYRVSSRTTLSRKTKQTNQPNKLKKKKKPKVEN